jgi:hypothetical protein
MRESLLYKRALVCMVKPIVSDIAEEIDRLFSGMKNTESHDIVVKDINDILLYADKVLISLLNPSWDYFAQRKGVKI